MSQGDRNGICLEYDTFGSPDPHAALQGSALLEIPGMGHDLPAEVREPITTAISELTGR